MSNYKSLSQKTVDKKQPDRAHLKTVKFANYKIFVKMNVITEK